MAETKPIIVNATLTKTINPVVKENGDMFGTVEMVAHSKKSGDKDVSAMCFSKEILTGFQTGMYKAGDEVQATLHTGKAGGKDRYYLDEMEIISQGEYDAAKAELPDLTPSPADYPDAEEEDDELPDLPNPAKPKAAAGSYTPTIPDADPVFDEDEGGAPTVNTKTTVVGKPAGAPLCRAEALRFMLKDVRNGMANLLTYVNAGTVSNILNVAYGDRWSVRTERRDGGLHAIIAVVNADGTVTSRENIGDKSMFSAAKGEESDAFKRAATRFGVATELSSSPVIEIPATKELVFTNSKGKTELRHPIVCQEIAYYGPTRTITKMVLVDNVTHKVVYTFERASSEIEYLPDPSEADAPKKGTTKKTTAAE